MVQELIRRLKKAIISTPIIGPMVLGIYRAGTAFSYIRPSLMNIFPWLFKSNETTNFTYDLEEINERYLASMIADITSAPVDVCFAYIKEVKNDNKLREHIYKTTKMNHRAVISDKEARFGRRVGWYALVRILKPKIVVETGVDKGLGACLLTAALKRNEEEGHKGWYYGTDINPMAGYLLTGDYLDHGSILYGDSIESLKKLDKTIDLFINDSDHSAEYEAAEYKTIAGKLSGCAMILGDNSHATDKLLEFSLETNRRFVFFQEKPHRHWYPGCGIGFSFKR
jgi:predicted O-methyltransferase YrrM